jgi:hypothetical protein
MNAAAVANVARRHVPKAAKSWPRALPQLKVRRTRNESQQRIMNAAL